LAYLPTKIHAADKSEGPGHPIPQRLWLAEYPLFAVKSHTKLRSVLPQWIMYQKFIRSWIPRNLPPTAVTVLCSGPPVVTPLTLNIPLPPKTMGAPRPSNWTATSTSQGCPPFGLCSFVEFSKMLERGLTSYLDSGFVPVGVAHYSGPGHRRTLVHY